MIEPSVDIIYKINGYPTMYIVDKEGTIAFAEIGFDEDKFEVLKHKMAELIEKQ